VSDLKLLF